MNNANTIRLFKGIGLFEKRYFKNFEKGGTIWGLDQEPEEVQRWDIDQKEEAERALASLRCEYRPLREAVEVTEYALEYCECDDDGCFIEGSDYDLAAEA